MTPDDGESAPRRPLRSVISWLTAPPDDDTNPVWNLVRRLAVIVPLATALLAGLAFVVTVILSDDDTNTADDASTEIAAPDSSATEAATDQTTDLKSCANPNDWDALPGLTGNAAKETTDDDGFRVKITVKEGFVENIDDRWSVILLTEMTLVNGDGISSDGPYHDDADYEDLETESGERRAVSCLDHSPGDSGPDGEFRERPSEVHVGFEGFESDPRRGDLMLSVHGAGIHLRE